MLKKLKYRLVKTKGVVAVVASTSFLATQANAALPTWASTMGADLGTAIDDVVTAVGPVVVASLIAFITIKLIKRGANKI